MAMQFASENRKRWRSAVLPIRVESSQKPAFSRRAPRPRRCRLNVPVEDGGRTAAATSAVPISSIARRQFYLPFNVAVTDSRKGRVSRAVSGIDRRSFIQLLAANSAFLAAAKASSRPPYYVGAGYSSDPYTAASVALSACGQFPTNLAGQTVVIKPNLVIGKPSTSGATTDPLVAQAIVDLCLAAGAAQILIVEAPAPGKRSNFGPCGYTAVFQNYPQVQLVDLRTGTYVLHPVPGGGYAYRAMWVPSLVLQPNTFFISAAKLKTHQNAVATLSMKNL